MFLTSPIVCNLDALSRTIFSVELLKSKALIFSKLKQPEMILLKSVTFSVFGRLISFKLWQL